VGSVTYGRLPQTGFRGKQRTKTSLRRHPQNGASLGPVEFASPVYLGRFRTGTMSGWFDGTPGILADVARLDR
jgi:hypothetical protein